MTIDWWTLGLQTFNVVILVWLLGHFFWRPVAAMIEQRRVASQTALAAAQAAQAKADAALAEAATTRAGFGAEREAILTAAHAEADKSAAAGLAQATQQIADLQAAAKSSAEREHADAETAWSDRASLLAVDIAGRLSARLHGPAVDAAFLDWLLAGIVAMPAATRPAADATLTAVSATLLSPADQESCRARITAAFGGAPHIEFAADAALIEGLELHGPDFIVGNSWRADLVSIRAALAHDA